ncbi:MGMT family protein [Paenibacillus sp. GCM10027626]|uniref:MGMT family protein n=1 Tax=Paenibacillus sp. GCM10027626 TaxID=3273411 RepID=UPI0036385952
MEPFTQRVIAVIKNIPAGKVMTYGQVAAEAGSPRGARQVVRILHSMSTAHRLPWHRVVNVKGEIAIQDEEGRLKQILNLDIEGVEVGEDGRIDLSIYRYTPEE